MARQQTPSLALATLACGSLRPTPRLTRMVCCFARRYEGSEPGMQYCIDTLAKIARLINESKRDINNIPKLPHCSLYVVVVLHTLRTVGHPFDFRTCRPCSSTWPRVSAAVFALRWRYPYRINRPSACVSGEFRIACLAISSTAGQLGLGRFMERSWGMGGLGVSCLLIAPQASPF